MHLMLALSETFGCHYRRECVVALTPYEKLAYGPLSVAQSVRFECVTRKCRQGKHYAQRNEEQGQLGTRVTEWGRFKRALVVYPTASFV